VNLLEGRLRRLKKEALPQSIFILGFVSAAVAQEAISILRRWTSNFEFYGISIYDIFITIILISVLFLAVKLTQKSLLRFKLSAKNPSGDLVPKGAIGICMMSFTVQSSIDDFILKSLEISYEGDSLNDINGIYLSIDGGRVSDVGYLELGKCELHLIRPIKMENGKVVTINVNCDFCSEAREENHHRIIIQSRDAFVSNAEEVIGEFPAEGNWFTINNAPSSLLTIHYQPSSQPQAIGGMIVSADTHENKTLYSMTLKMRGSVGSENVQNIHLKNSSGQKITVDAKAVENGYLTLIFDPPFTIPAGASEGISIHADIKNYGSVQMLLEKAGDIFAVGEKMLLGKLGSFSALQ
jgi:hypothetical protein